ncbi:MAG: LssY C-terminal domain-containing protein [Acidobacteriota bacterium]|nr:LssY C-terminal domain-containing protein [Acidobacteriota bacterium]
MEGMHRQLLALLMAFSGCALAASIEIPTGTQIQIRLTTTIDSNLAKAKQPFEAVVIAPVLVDGRFAIPQGTHLAGLIQEAKASSQPDEQSVVNLQFQELKDPHGSKAQLAAKLVDIDNARETVDEKGRIMGIIASQTASARLDQGINKLSQKYPALGDLLGTAKGAIVKEADPSIHYEPGVEMTIELTKPLRWEPRNAPDLNAISHASDLNLIVARQPVQTMAESPPRPSDLTNLMFIGSRADIESAFKETGWYPADPLTGQSKLETFKAIVEMRGYKAAPVSTLLLDGAPPDLVFQKQNNTFAQRHHLRLWLRPERFQGKQVWVCAATHDIGIDYSEEHRTFIHRVDPQIDKERAKVVNDLLFTGRVRGLALVDRINVPENGHNATGDPFETDRRMAVLEF